mmetsp:Transcript_7544/g.19191  ORF Transcript_7544/g.19191 Transcript_7544/m.19191 type:complete len:245 (+) Transcript_7544:3387-4121(+)
MSLAVPEPRQAEMPPYDSLVSLSARHHWPLGSPSGLPHTPPRNTWPANSHSSLQMHMPLVMAGACLWVTCVQGAPAEASPLQPPPTPTVTAAVTALSSASRRRPFLRSTILAPFSPVIHTSSSLTYRVDAKPWCVYNVRSPVGSRSKPDILKKCVTLPGSDTRRRVLMAASVSKGRSDRSGPLVCAEAVPITLPLRSTRVGADLSVDVWLSLVASTPATTRHSSTPMKNMEASDTVMRILRSRV